MRGILPCDKRLTKRHHLNQDDEHRGHEKARACDRERRSRRKHPRLVSSGKTMHRRAGKEHKHRKKLDHVARLDVEEQKQAKIIGDEQREPVRPAPRPPAQEAEAQHARRQHDGMKPVGVQTYGRGERAFRQSIDTPDVCLQEAAS